MLGVCFYFSTYYVDRQERVLRISQSRQENGSHNIHFLPHSCPRANTGPSSHWATCPAVHPCMHTCTQIHQSSRCSQSIQQLNKVLWFQSMKIGVRTVEEGRRGKRERETRIETHRGREGKLSRTHAQQPRLGGISPNKGDLSLRSKSSFLAPTAPLHLWLCRHLFLGVHLSPHIPYPPSARLACALFCLGGCLESPRVTVGGGGVTKTP